MEIKDMKAFLESSPNGLLNLKPDVLPAWGIMTPQHMVEHLAGAMSMSVKNTAFQTPASPETLKKIKNQGLTRGFRPGGSGAGKLKELKYPGLAAAVEAYTTNLNDFLRAAATAPLSTAHFYFGPLTNDEWMAFHYWHLQHHFKQFGIL